MSYSEETLRTKFDALGETQESIVNTSQWLLFHHRYHGRTVSAWKQYISTCDQKKKLPLLYIANEVIQQSRSKRRMDFVDSFAAVLPDTIKECYEVVPEKVKERMIKMVKVWRDRRIFSNDVEILGIKCPGSTPSIKPSSNGPERTNSPAPQNKPTVSPTKQPLPSSSSTSSSSSNDNEEVKTVIIPSIQKHKQTYEHLLLETEGKLTKEHVPQLEALTAKLQEEITALSELLNKVQKEINDIDGTTKVSQPESNPLALLQSLQQPAPEALSNPLALLQSISSSTAPPPPPTTTIQPPDIVDEEDDDDGYEPAESNQDPVLQQPQINNTAELLRRIEELKSLTQLQDMQQQQQQQPQPFVQLLEDEAMPSYDADGSDSEDEEKLPETIIKELSPTPIPVVSKIEIESEANALTARDGERPKKRLRFAL